MIRVAFMLFIAVQGLLVGLDCYDLRQAGRDGATDGWPPLRTIVFLFMTGGVFLSLQLLGSWIVPGADELLEGCRLLLTRAFGAQPAGEPTGWTLVWLGAVVFYTAGFWDYVVHRAFSHSRWFWFTHEYHHLPRKVSVIMPGILVRPFAFIPGCLTTLGNGTDTVHAVSDYGPAAVELATDFAGDAADCGHPYRQPFVVLAAPATRASCLEVLAGDHTTRACAAPCGQLAMQLWQLHDGLGPNVPNVS